MKARVASLVVLFSCICLIAANPPTGLDATEQLKNAKGGGITVNLKKNSHSHITIIADPGNPFVKGTTKVQYVKDLGNGFEWEPKNVTFSKAGTNANEFLRMHIQLKSKVDVKPIIIPDTGTITITLTPSPMVDPIPDVIYVNDDEP